MADQIASFYAKIGADAGEFERAMKKVSGDLSTTQKGFASFQSVAVAGLKAVGIAAGAAFAGLAAGVTSSIKAAADFEQGIADTSAVMSLTADEAANLQDHIMELGLSPDLKVSATEAQGAIMSLGTAGLSLDEIMNGASEATVQLSNATGGPMADSAALVTDIMSQFGIATEDAGRIVDQVTGLTVASKFAFGDAALAIAQAGGVAGSTGLEFEDFNAILGVTAANFSSGSDAGTSLKTFLTTLIPKSQEAEDAMKELGLITVDYSKMASYLSGVLGYEVAPTFQATEAAFRETAAGAEAAEKGNDELIKAFSQLRAQYSENQFFDDTTGAMRDAESIAGVLAQAFGGLSDEQRNEAASTISGNDAMRTAFGLMQAGTPGITKMKDEISKVDAGNIAAKRMDTFAGAVEIAQGVIETISISIGQQFLPILRPLVEQFSSMAQTHGPRLIEMFGGLAARMGEGIQKGIEWAQQVLPPLWEKMQQVGNVIKVVTTYIMNIVRPITNAIDKFFDWQDILMALGVLLLGGVAMAIASFIASLTPVILLVTRVAAVIAWLRNAWESDFLGIQGITANVLDQIKQWIQTYTGLWKGDWGKTMRFFVTNTEEAFRGLVDGALQWLRYWYNEGRHIVMTFVNGIAKEISDWTIVTKSKIHIWVGWMNRYFEEFKEWGMEQFDRLFGWFKPSEWLQKGKDIIQGLWDGAKQVWQNFKDWWSGLWRTLTGTVDVKLKIGSPSKEMFDRGAWAVEGFAKGAQDAMPMVNSAMDGLSAASMNAGASAAPAVSTSRIEELLTILIAELRAKNMSANVTVAGGGENYGALAGYLAGARR